MMIYKKAKRTQIITIAICSILLLVVGFYFTYEDTAPQEPAVTEVTNSRFITKVFPRYVVNSSTTKIDTPSFSITFPSTWEVTTRATDQNILSDSPKEIAFSKGDVRLEINRSGGGHLCLPPDNYLDLTTAQTPPLEMRITTNPSGLGELDHFIFCGKPEDGTYDVTRPVPEGSIIYLTNTKIGEISLFSDYSNVESIDKEILQIVQSIKIFED